MTRAGHIQSFFRTCDAAVFDLDGTLIDDKIHRDKHAAVLAHTDVNLPHLVPGEKEWNEFAGLSDADFYALLVRNAAMLGHADKLPPQKAYIDAIDAYFYANIHTIMIRDGAMDILDAVAARGIPKGVATNGVQHETLMKLRRVKLDTLFDTFSCLDHVKEGCGKPQPDIYLDSFKKRKSIAGGSLKNPSRMAAFEDTDHGALAALRAGFGLVVLWEQNWRTSKIQAHPNLLVTRNADEIVALIRKPTMAPPRMAPADLALGGS